MSAIANSHNHHACPTLPTLAQWHEKTLTCICPHLFSDSLSQAWPVTALRGLTVLRHGWNSRLAKVKSLRHCRRLLTSPRPPSACLAGPVGALVRWFFGGRNRLIRERFAVDRPFGASTLRGRRVGRKPQTYRGVPPRSEDTSGLRSRNHGVLHPLARMMVYMPLPRGGREGGLAWPSPLSPPRPPSKHGLRLPDRSRPVRGAPELAIC
jgi:hypothetical protein